MTHGSRRVAHCGSSHCGNQKRSRCVIKETTTTSMTTTEKNVNSSRVLSATNGSVLTLPLAAASAPTVSSLALKFVKTLLRFATRAKPGCQFGYLHDDKPYDARRLKQRYLV
jgi:hypothetical protein